MAVLPCFSQMGTLAEALDKMNIFSIFLQDTKKHLNTKQHTVQLLLSAICSSTCSSSHNATCSTTTTTQWASSTALTDCGAICLLWLWMDRCRWCSMRWTMCPVRGIWAVMIDTRHSGRTEVATLTVLGLETLPVQNAWIWFFFVFEFGIIEKGHGKIILANCRKSHIKTYK